MHLVCFAPAFPSHVTALAAVAEHLAARGHRLTLVHHSEVAGFVPDGALRFHALGTDRLPPGWLPAMLDRAARPGGPLGIRRVIRDMAGATDMLCAEGPRALERLGADAVIADQMEAAGGLVAAAAGLPFVSLASALPIEPDPQVPLPVLPFRFDPSPAGLHRNRVAARIYDLIMRPHGAVVDRWAARFGLGPRRSLADCLSPLATIGQTVAAFDLPRLNPAPRLHHLGPFRSDRAEPNGAAPADRGDGRPRAFCSLGTLQGWRLGLFRRIARACRQAGVHLTVAHCGRLSDEQARTLGADRVVAFAPQRATIAASDLVITHGGLNTVMDAAAAGVPVLVLPIAFDQPGVAARVAHHGLGIALDHRLSGAGRIERAIRALLSDHGYRAQARRMAEATRAAGGARAAADVVEAALGLAPARLEAVS